MESTLADKAYQYILDLIFSKKLFCGDKIDEKRISDEMHISRTPIREAIRKLAASEIVDIYPNRTAEIHSFSEQQLMDMGLVRLSTDSLAVQLAILNGSNRDFMKLEAISDECDRAMQARNLYERIRLDCEFHIFLVEIGKNQELLNIQKNLALKFRLLQSQLLLTPDSNCCDLSQHTAIIQALKARDPALALKAVQDHLISFYKLEPLFLNFQIPFINACC